MKKTVARLKDHLKELNGIEMQYLKEIHKIEIEINKVKLTIIERDSSTIIMLIFFLIL